MTNYKRYLLLNSMALLMVACSSDVPEIIPDGGDEIRVSLAKGISTRAVAGYRDWSADSDPTTMGVIAFTDGMPSSYIYNNVSFEAPRLGIGAWERTSGEKARWSHYTTVSSMDFFACMPYVPGTTVSRHENTYTLTIGKVPGTSAEPYLVSTLPVHYTSVSDNMAPVQLQMDQIMTAFDFQFALSSDMAKLRTFSFTKVKMSGLPVTSTVKQNYTFSDGAWSKGNLSVSDVSVVKTATAEAVSSEGMKIGYNHGDTEYGTFPGTLYMLPFDLSVITPKIEVTYDVYDQEGYKTRTVTSEILLNKTNFGSFGVVQSAHKNIIRIKIVPTSLHVLSDADQSTTGYLVVES